MVKILRCISVVAKYYCKNLIVGNPPKGSQTILSTRKLWQKKWNTGLMICIIPFPLVSKLKELKMKRIGWPYESYKALPPPPSASSERRDHVHLCSTISRELQHVLDRPTRLPIETEETSKWFVHMAAFGWKTMGMILLLWTEAKKVDSSRGSASIKFLGGGGDWIATRCGGTLQQLWHRTSTPGPATVLHHFQFSVSAEKILLISILCSPTALV